jgi:glycosyltransferase involved in cell wall biosynthesis
MQITYFFRKPKPHYHSIERVFNLIIQNLSDEVQTRIYKLKSGDKGVFSRLKALMEVWKNKGEINHITGDIYYVAMVLPRKGLVVTYHDLESLVRSGGFRSKVLKWFWVNMPARRAQAVTVISEHTKKLVMDWSGIADNKIHVIANPLPHGFSYHPKTELSEKPALLVIGTKYNKNLQGIIEAIDGLSCRLIIAGRLSTLQLDLLAQNQIDYENLVGASDDQIIDAYKRCDLLCFPSLFEGFGMPIIEAQAIGRPVITSSFGAMKEVAGEGALLVDPHQADDIRNGIVTLLNDADLRSKLVAKGLENAAKFNAKTLAIQYAKVYEGIVI